MFDRDTQSHRSANRADLRRAQLRRDVRRTCRVRRDRHGIILVFVIVLLVLLAIMGTAYLAVSRADRQNIGGRGASADGARRPLLRDTSLFERLHALTEERVKLALVEELFGRTTAAGFTPANYRKTTNAGYLGFTGYGSFANNTGQDWLASLLPDVIDTNTTTDPVARTQVLNARYRPGWRWTSGPLARPAETGTFASTFMIDPRDVGNTGTMFTASAASSGAPTPFGADRRDAAVTSVALPRAAGSSSPMPRIYPAFQLLSRNRTTIAADADGDGIPDARLVPLVLDASVGNANSAARYVDTANNVFYTYSVRIVDNSAQVNVNTALSVRAGSPFKLSTLPSSEASTDSAYSRLRIRVSDTGAIGVDQPNLGFFRSNVGLVELFDGLESYYTTSLPNSPAVLGPAVRHAEIERLLNYRVPGMVLNNDYLKFNSFAPSSGTNPDAATLNTHPASYESAGQLRLSDGRGVQLRAFTWSTAPGTVASSSTATTSSLLFHQSLNDYLDIGIASRPNNPASWGKLAAQPADIATEVNASASPLYRGAQFGEDSSRSLAVRGGSLKSSYLGQTSLESTLLDTTQYGVANFGSSSSTWNYFPANEGDLWYNWTKDFRRVTDGTADAMFYLPTSTRAGQIAVPLQRSLRPLLTADSGVTQYTPTRPATAISEMAPYGINVGQHPPTRVSATTAPFAALWRAYFSAMTTETGAALPGGVNAFSDEMIWRWGRAAGQNSPAGNMFALTGATGTNTTTIARLRAAIAAANLIAMRRVGDGILDPDATDTTNKLLDRDVPAFGVSLDGTYRARIYGMRPQPFITEVICTPGTPTDPDNTSALYIELYNPFPFDIDLTGYRLAAIRRVQGAAPTGQTVAGSYIDLVPQTIVTLTGVIPANGFVVVGDGTLDPAQVNNTGFSAAPSGAQARLISSAGATAFRSAGMRAEIVLLRTRRNDGVEYTARATAPADLLLNTSEDLTADPLTLVPLDCIDLRPVPAASLKTLADGTTQVPYFFEYRRANSGATDGDRWRCVYAGPMQRSQDPDGTLRPGVGAAYNPTLQANHQRDNGGTVLDVLAIRDTSDPATVNAAGRGSLGQPNIHSATVAANAVFQTAPGTATFVAPIINLHFSSLARTATLPGGMRLSADRAPFGTPFARDGDLINVPFIGSYVIEKEQGSIWQPVEIVPISLDAVAADNVELSTATNPSVGRFDPLQTTTSWATSLTDYLSARHGGGEMLFPAVPRLVNADGTPTADAPTQGAESANGTRVRWVVSGSSTGTANASLNPLVAVQAGAAPLLLQGKININTAPAAILQMLPFAVGADGRIDHATNRDVAEAIEQLRSQPVVANFPNLHALRNFQPAAIRYWQVLPAITSVNNAIAAGDITPALNGADLGDYKRQTLNYTRLSNLATTRSDVFTVYVTVQAWSYQPGAATETRLVAEKRSAFIVDRSAIGPTANGTNVNASTGDLRVIPIEQE